MQASPLFLLGLLTLVPASGIAQQRLTYPVVGTGQTLCYDNSREMTCPPPGQAFHGQDAQTAVRLPGYTLSPDGLTVQDKHTGLTWQRSPDLDGDGRLNRSDKLTGAQAKRRPAELNAARYGGYNDWRLPTIKELYSLIKFDGREPSGPPGGNYAGPAPFIDTHYFGFAYGQVEEGERTIDAQYASATLYVNRGAKLFGVNFADGLIKGYDLFMPGRADKTFFVLCVRGNPDYGKNDFRRHGDGTISDRASGLMWSQADSGVAMNWQDALAWVQARNRQNHLARNDWRLPNAKELQSIVDYARSPDASASAAISPLFDATPIINEAGQSDYATYWSSTTHASARGGGTGVYVAFGRALGFMRGGWQDVHGAGAQRSDPKVGDPAQFPNGRGPQGDAVRIYNFVRLVRTEQR